MPPAPDGAPPYDAVVLAGGAARRLGGADKPGARVGGRALVERVAGAVADAGRIVVVGPARDGLAGAVFVQESPPGGGPVPALRAGLEAVTAPWVALLAADLPFLRADHVGRLLAAAAPAGGAVLVDQDGREQWLAGVWRTETLRAALGVYEGRSLRGLLGPLLPVCLGLPVGEDGRAPWFDCDTAEDLAAAETRATPRPPDDTHGGTR
ncbi:molybdenum cofactor guanylyltransferase [Sphaerisporangium aureirubrum]|uniref:Molybdenum cofactor guanylyltransferase n=1 Tax=Sphaerisporangium aureirubrum TaxID=1544736 RepID=A0ABW1NT33_9ACTN